VFLPAWQISHKSMRVLEKKELRVLTPKGKHKTQKNHFDIRIQKYQIFALEK
jgi:hypothetical protein